MEKSIKSCIRSQTLWDMEYTLRKRAFYKRVAIWIMSLNTFCVSFCYGFIIYDFFASAKSRPNVMIDFLIVVGSGFIASTVIFLEKAPDPEFVILANLK